MAARLSGALELTADGGCTGLRGGALKKLQSQKPGAEDPGSLRPVTPMEADLVSDWGFSRTAAGAQRGFRLANELRSRANGPPSWPLSTVLLLMLHHLCGFRLVGFFLLFFSFFFFFFFFFSLPAPLWDTCSCRSAHVFPSCRCNMFRYAVSACGSVASMTRLRPRSP